VPTSSLTSEALQIVGHANKSLRKFFVHKVRDIAFAGTGLFGISLGLFPIALCSLRYAFHVSAPQLPHKHINWEMGRRDEGGWAKARLNWTTASASARVARSAFSLAAPALMSSPRVLTPIA
jgi:hypothetical protein